MGIGAQVNWLTLPLHFEAVRAFGKRIDWGTVVGKGIEVLIFPIGGHCPAGWLGREASTRGQSLAGGGPGATVPNYAWGRRSSCRTLRFCYPVVSVGARNPRWLDRNHWLGLGRHNSMVAVRPCAAISLEKSALFAKPAFGVGPVVLHDLRLESQDQVVLFAGWRFKTAKVARRSGSKVVVDNPLMVLELVRRKKRCLGRARGCAVIGRIQNWILDVLSDWSRRRFGWMRHRFAVWRHRRRHGQRVLVGRAGYS